MFLHFEAFKKITSCCQCSIQFSSCSYFFLIFCRLEDQITKFVSVVSKSKTELVISEGTINYQIIYLQICRVLLWGDSMWDTYNFFPRRIKYFIIVFKYIASAFVSVILLALRHTMFVDLFITSYMKYMQTSKVYSLELLIPG